MPSNFDYSTLLTDDQPDDSGFDYSTLLEDSAGTKTGKAVQRVGDVAISLGKGVVGVPQAITGIADVFTGGEAGKAVEESGVRFKDAQDILSGLQSPEQKAANAEVANADGFVDTAKAAIDNPSTIVNSVAESLPAMGAGGVVARGGIGAAGLISRGLAEKAVPVMAGFGEGAVTAGQIAEQVREENPDGLLTDKQALAATGAGIVTGGIGAAAAKLVNTKFGQRLGLADMDVLIAKGGPDAVTASAAKTGFIKSMLSSGFSEGVLEELPQSAQEQMWQNYAQGKPITEGVGNAAATGLLAGAAMGAAGGGYSAAMGNKNPSNQIDVEAGNEFLQRQQDLHQGQADQTVSNQAPEADPVTPEAPSATPEAAPGITGDVTAAIDRISELEIKASQDGLTPQEQAEHQALSQTIAENLAQENQETPTPEAVQPETQPTGEVQPAESIVPAEPSQPFQPTHTLSDGTPVKFDQEENAYVGADGSLYEPDGYETPIAEAQINTETNPNSGENAPAQAVISQDVANVQPENTGQSGEVLPGNSEVQSQGDTGQAQDSLDSKSRFLSSDDYTVSSEDNGNFTVSVKRTKDGGVVILDGGQIIEYNKDFSKGKTDADLLKYTYEPVGFTGSDLLSNRGEQTNQKPQPLVDQVSQRFNGADVSNVTIDDEFGNVTATVNGIKGVDAGFIEDYQQPLLDTPETRLAAYQEKFPKASDAVTEILRKAAEAKSKPVRDSYLREAEKLHGETKPAKPAKNNLTSPPTGKEELQAAIRKLGGIKREGIADRAGFTDFKGRKYTGLFSNGKNAKTLDEMAELLRGYDYQIDGENDLIEKLYNSLNGQPHYSPAGAEAYATKLIEESAKAEQAQADDENAIEAAEERAAIQAADDIEPDAEYDEIFETVLSNDRQNTGRITNLDDIFGPETASTEESTGAADTGATVQRAAESSAQAGNNTATDRESQKQQRSQSKGGDEKGNQGNEQASGGISDKAQRTAELFKANPQKIINGLTSTGKIKQLHDAAGVMTSAGFKDLPMADKVAAYVKMVTGEIIPGEPKPKGAPVETDLFVNSEEERKALEAKQGAANVAAAKDKKRQGDGAEPPPLFSDNAAMAGQVDIEDAAHEAATSPKNDLTEPTQAQKEAGNYKKGHVTLHGLNIAIENPRGSTRSGVDGKGNAWSVEMAHHYGYIKRTEGADGDHVDVFIGPNPESGNVYVVNQIDPRTKQFDEHKVMLGFNTQEEARAGYLANYSKGWKGIGSVTPMSMDDFKAELNAGTLDKPIKKPSNTQATKITQTPESSSYGKANKVFTEDAAAKARELLKSKLGTVRSGLDPEMIQAGITLAGYHVESGARAFADYTKAMVADLGDGIRPYLRSFYEGVRYYPGFDNAGMSTAEEIDNVSSTDSGLESDSGNATDEDRNNEEAVQPERSGDGPATGKRSRKTQGGRSGLRSDSGDSINVAAAGRERGNQPVHSAEQPTVSSELAPGIDDSERGDTPGNSGIQSKPIPSAEVNRLSQPRNQKTAATGNVIISDLDNIRAMMPFLNNGQVQDVKFAEDRFSGHAGVLFTNGTGTGKTFSGLGVIKRFALQGKDNVIIAVPSVNIADQWRKAADKFFNLPISLLENTRDAGKGVVITTYANFGMNRSLVNRDWNLIVADESHKLMQNEAGDETDALKTLRGISYHSRGFYAWLEGAYPDVMDELRAARSDMEAFSKDDTMDQLYFAAKAREGKALDAYQEALKEGRERYANLQKTKSPKVMLLSATPFAYVKTVDYAEGYLFDYEKDVNNAGYNSGDGRERFFMSNFGYRMRYNKLTAPEANVDTGIMERQFNSTLKKSGALSFRMLDVPFDYDRKFQLVDNALGQRIDEAMEWIRTNEYRELAEELEDKFDHLQRRYLLEAIKAKEAIPVIKDHLAHGRKVVVFHDYKKGGATNPFLLRAAGPGPLADQIREFNAKFKDIVSAFDYLPSPIAGMREEFGDGLMVYNGSVPTKERIKLVEQFNDDNSGKNLILVQSASAKEGVSFHDTTGKHQRVLINLGLPTQPTTAIQQEGRIYRVGQQSDALFRYLNTGTNWERWAFATTIANRASTAENLGAGEGARALKDAFINGFESSDDYPAGYDGEGKGGKEADKAATSTLTAFERAKSFYFGQQKKTSRNKSAEGTDYFATPEPVGLKMAEWADIRTGDHVLEPSAGHGAIARWFRDDAIRTAIEPSGELSSRLAMVFDGDVKRQTFEDLHIVNKYNAIVMNPPFGVGGKTAIEHLDKAFKHLPDNGRIVALIPQGSSADKRFDKWFYDNEATKHASLIATISLPNATFERAGTSVKTRIVIIDKITDQDLAQNISTKTIDLDNAENIGELFDRLENISMPDRKAPVISAPEPSVPTWQGVKKANEQANQAAKEVEAKAQEAGVIVADASQATFELVGDKILTNAPAEQVITKKGKELDGVFVPDEKMARTVDQFTYRPNGKEAGWFVRLRHVQRPVANDTMLSRGVKNTESLDDFSSRIKLELGLKQFHVFINSSGNIELSNIIVNKSDQNHGKGSKALQMLVDYADSTDKTIVLTPGLPNDHHGTTSRSRLVRFYKRFGFVESKGRNIDYAIGAGKMYRHPGVRLSRNDMPSLISLFESMGKRSSKSAPIEIDQHPQAALIKAVQDNWADVLLQVGYEKADKSDNPNGKVFIQC